jgi:Mycobacterium membrane protein
LETDGKKVERVDSVVDGKVPEVEREQSGDTIASGNYAARPTPASETAPLSRKRRRNSGIGFFKAFKLLWIPLVIVVVLIGGGFAVSRLHGVFGSDKTVAYGDTRNDDAKPFNPKHMRYEIFGPPGTVAQISYFDENGDPAHVDAAALPWSLEFPVTGAAGIGSLAAQGESDNIGCRILIDGVIKSEKVATHEVSTFVSCQLKAA